MVLNVRKYGKCPPMKVASVAEMRAMDRRAAEEFSIPEVILMENAGLAAFSVLSRRTGVAGRKYAVLCGPGNNGGDGLVVARLLHSGGAGVKVFLAGEEGKFRGPAKSNLEIVKKLPVETIKIVSAAAIREEIIGADVIVDALLGTGLDREVSGLFRDLIELTNKSGRKVLSLDIPSGINGDTGEVMGTAVRADWTVTFGLPKIGNILYPGYGHCGRLSVSHISFPPSLYEDPNLKVRLNSHLDLPPRPAEAHKGKMGKALFIAGSANYYGAPLFSALSFYKAGGGYAYLAAPKSMIPAIAQKGSEIVFLPQEETEAGSISPVNGDNLLDMAEKTDIVVLGPGLSLEEKTKHLVKALAAAIKKPLLIDGDGITALAEDLSIVSERQAPTILTPHVGEMARLTGHDLSRITTHKIPILLEAAANLRALIVLKGAHSLIGTPDGTVYVNLSGNPGMATAGSGDVLTGAIAAMFGLGLPLSDATRKGVSIHGLAGDLAAASKGEDGITAQDIMEYLPLAMKRDRELRR